MWYDKSGKSETSLKAYYFLKANQKDITQVLRICSLLKDKENGLTRREIALALGMELSSVCGRVNELKKGGVIDVIGTTKCSRTKREVELLGYKVV